MGSQTAQPVSETLSQHVVLAADCREEFRELIPGARQQNGNWSAMQAPFVLIADNVSAFTPELRVQIESHRARLVYILCDGSRLPDNTRNFPVYFFLHPPFQRSAVESVVRSALDNLRLCVQNAALTESLARAQHEIQELNRIGIALSAQRDLQELLDLILSTSRQITNSDAGSLYLVEENENTGDKVLRFTLTQNDSVSVPFNQYTIPIDSTRISGYCALTGRAVALEDAYSLPSDVPFGFSQDFDQKIGYRTKSMLAVPMQNQKGEVVGVLQLINCKRSPHDRVTPEDADAVVIPYPESLQQLVKSLASQAAVALENTRLYENIQKLFEGFVQASVVAIESRDPTTFGHSFRVEKLTVALAEAVDRADDGQYSKVKFSREQLREIRYASVLHDFGKVGVREEVLVKAKKLYPQQLLMVRERFNFVRKSVIEEHQQKKLQYVLEKGRDDYLARSAQFDAELAARLKEIDDFFQFVLRCNEPTVLPEGNFERLVELAQLKYLDDWDGEEKSLLLPDEARLLSIPKGSLDPTERTEIESHVIHTFNFLTKIPWTKEMRNIPLIARAHHEKLDGTGYPFQLNAADIPIQSRMMTISDIYDALSASDRPYKKAVPAEKALAIIESDVKKELLDRELFRIFLDRQIWKLTQK